MKLRRAGLLVGMALVVAPAVAHIGSPDTFFEGMAGPYPLRVIIRDPGVIPGVAEITVRVKEGVTDRVTVRPVHWSAGLEGAPPADIAEPVRGESGLYTAELWMMTSSSYSIYVDVEGPEGEGTAVVPLPTVASRRLEMDRRIGSLLAVLGLLLFAGAVTAVGAAIRESVLEPGAQPTDRRRRVARRAMFATAGVILLGLYGGKLWWDSSDQSHEQRIFKPFEITTEARVEPSGHRTLRLSIEDRVWRSGRWTPMVPDHGKLMHMFLIREPELDAFAHIHPLRLDKDTFEVNVPPLPGGSYRVYADVTHGSGFAQTMTDLVQIPGPTGATGERDDHLTPDPDDSWRVADAASSAEHAFDDGARLVWQDPGPIRIDHDVDLEFRLETAAGDPMPIEPYMGMVSHAAVRRRDGAVFVHLHPTGTISMVAQQMFERQSFQSDDEEAAAGNESPREPRVVTGHDMALHAAMVVPDGTVSMPYAFPRSGTYRIWVQVKSAGEVYTGVYDLTVDETAGSS